MKRSITILSLIAILTLAIYAPSTAAQEKTTIRIGYQRADLSSLLIEQGTLEEALGDEYEVEWTLFAAGPPLLEALNAGSIDFGATGNIPPIFAQAGGVPLRYVATQVSSTGQAILVPGDSEIESLADLEGKKVAWTHGSSAHYLVVTAIEAGGLTLEDVESADLLPTDALAAFQGGSVDAWAIWDPFLTIAELTSGGRILEGSEDLTDSRSYYLASADFSENHPDVINTILEQIGLATNFVRDNLDEYTDILAEQTGLDKELWTAVYEGREIYDPEPITEDVIASQQEIADKFFELELLPEPIDISEAIWTWEQE
jgi:sulfonate transport system substrate-binding protein